MLDLIQPKELEIDGKIYIISKFPALAAREILTQMPSTAAAATIGHFIKGGDYKLNEAITLKIMHYVAVKLDNGTNQRLTSQNLIDVYVTSDFPGETLLKIEDEMLGYNCSFFGGGRVSTFCADIVRKLPVWTTQILTDFLEQSSRKEKPH